MNDTLTIQVNGDTREVPQGLNVTQLLEHLGLLTSRLAIERNLQILPRREWGTTLVSSGDKFEIVHLVGGGG
jgi:thiamine biosynthesis protein ThiS